MLHRVERIGPGGGLLILLAHHRSDLVHGHANSTAHTQGNEMIFIAIAVCLVVIELTDIVVALDSIPAVLSVSTDTFIMVTSNIFAIMGLRSLYFVLAGAMEKFKYLKVALAFLLIFIGAKMFAHNWIHIPHWLSLVIIAGIIATGVAVSLLLSEREPASPSP